MQADKNDLEHAPLPRQASRIVLRRLRMSDAEHFHAYRSDPKVAEYQGWSVMSMAEATAFLAQMSKAPFAQAEAWFQFAIADRSDDRLIGDVGICLRLGEDPYAEIGFSLDSRWQGKGLGSEAVKETLSLLFEHTAVSHVVAIADARNLPCVHLLERIGMVKVETTNAIFRGEPCIEYVFKSFRPQS